jgi:uncharacterized protein
MGLNVNAVDIYGDTPLHLAARNGHREVSEILIEYGGNPTIANNAAQKPSCLARLGGHTDLAERLEEHERVWNVMTACGVQLS